MSIESNKEIVRRFVEALDTGDLAVVTQVCTPECAEIWKHGINVPPWTDHHLTITGMIGEGHVVAATMQTRGRVDGDFHGIPGRGLPFENDGVVIYEFAEDKIASVQPHFDDLGIAGEHLGGRLTLD